MRPKRTELRERARLDIEEAASYYRAEAGAKIAIQFIDAIQETIRSVSEEPAIGSPRYAHELGIRALRSRKVGKFPHLIFYVEGEGDVDIWRVLHAARDIPAWLSEPED